MLSQIVRVAILGERKALLERGLWWHPEEISIYQGSGEGGKPYLHRQRTGDQESLWGYHDC